MYDTGEANVNMKESAKSVESISVPLIIFAFFSREYLPFESDTFKSGIIDKSLKNSSIYSWSLI